MEKKSKLPATTKYLLFEPRSIPTPPQNFTKIWS